jgi:hypothetical protein
MAGRAGISENRVQVTEATAMKIGGPERLGAAGRLLDAIPENTNARSHGRESRVGAGLGVRAGARRRRAAGRASGRDDEQAIVPWQIWEGSWASCSAWLPVEWWWDLVVSFF